MQYIRNARSLIGLGAAGLAAYKAYRPGAVYTARNATRSIATASRRGTKRAYPKRVKREIHYLDGASAGAIVIPNGGGIYICNNVAEGTEYNQRNGRNIHMCYIQIDANITPPTNASSVDLGNWALVLDVAGAGSAPAYSDIFDVTVNSIGQAFKKLSTGVDRFHILKSGTFNVENGSPDQPERIKFVAKIPYKFARATFSGTGATNPLTNAVYFVVGSLNSTGVAATSASIILAIRCAWVDV